MGSGSKMPHASWPDEQRAEGRWARNQVHAFFPLAFVHPSLSKHEPLVCLPLMGCVRGGLRSQHLLIDRTSSYPPWYRGGSRTNRRAMGQPSRCFRTVQTTARCLHPAKRGREAAGDCSVTWRRFAESDTEKKVFPFKLA